MHEGDEVRTTEDGSVAEATFRRGDDGRHAARVFMLGTGFCSASFFCCTRFRELRQVRTERIEARDGWGEIWLGTDSLDAGGRRPTRRATQCP